jgi:hypothetical protein
MLVAFQNTIANGDKYWEYAFCYVDDIIIISHDPQKAMDFLSSKYKLKDGSIKEPDFYLGADILRWKIDGCNNPTKLRWAILSDTYVKRTVAEVDCKLSQVDDQRSTKMLTQQQCTSLQ